MANTYKNAKKALTGANQTIYTCPGATTAIVQAIHAANVASPSADKEVTIDWTDASDSNTATTLASTMFVPEKSALNILDRPLVLEAGDTIRGLGVDIHVTLSILEIS